MVFEASGYFELLALHNALLEAKFVETANNRDVAGSPLVATLARRALEALVSEDINRNGTKMLARWSEWRALDSSRREWGIAIRRAREKSDWSRLTCQEKESHARSLVAPFEVSQDQINDFLDEVNR